MGEDKPSSVVNKRIVVDEGVLFGCEPTLPVCLRKDLVNKICFEVNKFNEGRFIHNFLLYGSCGCGKTVIAKSVLKNFEAKDAIKVVYVDCWRYYTRMAVYSLIAKAIGEPIPRRGLATDEVFDRLTQVLKATNQKVLIVLDEIDGLLFNQEQRLLYDLASEPKLFCFIGVCDDSKGFTELNRSLKSGLRLSELEVKPFSESELLEVLQEKASKAIARGSLSKEILVACVKQARTSTSNVKIALELLWKACLHAERNKKSKVLLEDLVSSNDSETNKKLVRAIKQDLNKEEQLIVSILSTGSMNSSKLYARFQRKLVRTKRQIRNYLKKLVANGVILVEGVDSNNFLKPKLFKLNFSKLLSYN